LETKLLQSCYIAGVGAIALSVLALAPSQALAQACVGGSTLSGGYSLYVNGSTPSSGSQIAKFIVGQATFNGACGFSATLSYSENNAATLYSPVTGTYNQQTDGTFTISFKLPGESTAETYEIGYSPITSGGNGNETDKGGVAVIHVQAQSTTGSKAAYGNASFKGTWTIACRGLSGGYSDLNYQVFDGTTSAQGIGNISGTDYYNNFASPGVEPYSGSYATLANGIYGGALTVAGEAFGYTGVLSNNGNEIDFFFIAQSANTPYAGVTGCTGTRVK
jgi:hypothetical protein